MFFISAGGSRGTATAGEQRTPGGQASPSRRASAAQRGDHVEAVPSRRGTSILAGRGGPGCPAASSSTTTAPALRSRRPGRKRCESVPAGSRVGAGSVVADTRPSIPPESVENCSPSRRGRLSLCRCRARSCGDHRGPGPEDFQRTVVGACRWTAWRAAPGAAGAHLFSARPAKLISSPRRCRARSSSLAGGLPLLHDEQRRSSTRRPAPSVEAQASAAPTISW